MSNGNEYPSYGIQSILLIQIETMASEMKQAAASGRRAPVLAFVARPTRQRQWSVRFPAKSRMIVGQNEERSEGC